MAERSASGEADGAQSSHDWRRAFARQARSDLAVYDFLTEAGRSDLAACHRMLYLQMVWEKTCKAFLLKQDEGSSQVSASHRVIEKQLPRIVAEYHRQQKGKAMPAGQMGPLRQLARDIENLYPSGASSGHSSRNCKYPWIEANRVVAPVDIDFPLDRVQSHKLLVRLRKILNTVLHQMEAVSR